MGSSSHGGSHHGNNDGQYNEQPQVQSSPQNLEGSQHALQNQNNNLTDRCFDYSNMFNECMRLNFNNSTICSQAFEDLKKCQNSFI